MIVDSLKVLLASTYGFSIKTQNFHWNIEGPNFPQYHKMLDDIYTEVSGSIDTVAEYIRILGSYTPASFTEFSKMSIVKDQLRILKPTQMLTELLEDNKNMVALLKTTFEVADKENEQGIADFISGRIDAHGKHGWFLRSTLKNEEKMMSWLSDEK